MNYALTPTNDSQVLQIASTIRRVAASSVIEVGKNLQRAKELVPVGKWGAYVEDQCGISTSTARKAMQVARVFSAHQAAAANIGTEALRYLSSSDVEDSVFQECLALAQNGERVTMKVVEEIEGPPASLAACNDTDDQEEERDNLAACNDDRDSLADPIIGELVDESSIVDEWEDVEDDEPLVGAVEIAKLWAKLDDLGRKSATLWLQENGDLEAPEEPKKGNCPRCDGTGDVDKNELIDLPFPSDKFRKAWGDWVAFRKESRKPLKPTSVKSQLAKLKEWGEQASIEAIESSIMNGYQGLFKPKAGPAAIGNRIPGFESGMDHPDNDWESGVVKDHQVDTVLAEMDRCDREGLDFDLTKFVKELEKKEKEGK